MKKQYFLLTYTVVKMFLGITLLFAPATAILELGVEVSIFEIESMLLIAMAPVILFEAIMAWKHNEYMWPFAISWLIGSAFAIILQTELDILAAVTLFSMIVGPVGSLIWLLKYADKLSPAQTETAS